jgi:hypothetical protein
MISDVTSNSTGAVAWRSNVLLFAFLILLFSTLIIDGYPAGTAALREFGARPTNFLLAPAMFVLISQQLLSGAPFHFTRRELYVALVAGLGIPALNLPIALLLQPDTPTQNLIVDWCKQYAMLLWGLTSYLIWRRLIRSVSPRQLGGLICLGSIVPLLGFFGDLSGSSEIQRTLGIFRIKEFSRASGLATEPSLYASWCAFVWPLILFYAMHARSFAARTFGMILFLTVCASAYLSHARTVAVVVILQISYYGLWAMRRTTGVQRLRALLVLLFFATATVAAFAVSLSTLGDAEMGSNIVRIGSTVTAVRVSLAHPMLGVGIGQLRYFFGTFAPDFALASNEILTYATGVSEYRASAFNLFVRFFCEFGCVVGLAFSIFVLRPVFSAARLRTPDRAILYATLSAIGGLGFWLSQDQYGYQPGILSLAVLTHFLSIRPGSRAQPQS